MRRLPRVALVTATLVACTACGASGSRDKAGGDTLVLRLATIDAIDNNGQSYGPAAFVAALEEVSDGRIKVEVDTSTYGDGSADEEARIVAAIAAGDLDGGWPSTRAFAAAGVTGLESVEAPLLLTSYDAVKDLVTSEAADLLLDTLSESGVVGLGLTVGPLRRPFAAREPLLGPEDWEGQGFRSFNSPVQDAAVRALGGRPLHLGESWPDKAQAGELRGVEFDVAQYHQNGMTNQAGHLTGNVVLWPKVFVLSLSAERWDTLSEEQRAWVREAADRAVQESVEAEYDEAGLVRQMCLTGGMRLYDAPPRDRAALRRELAPVVEDVTQGEVGAAVREVAQRHPETETLDAGMCRGAPSIRTVDRIGVPDEAGDLPPGVYRIEVRPEDLEAAEIGPAADGFTGVWTLTVSPGRFELDCTPLAESTGIDCNYGEELGPGFDINPREVGGLYGTGGTVWFEHETRTESEMTDCVFPPSETELDSCLPSFVHRVDWELEGDQLVMSGMLSESPSYQLVIGPWSKIE